MSSESDDDLLALAGAGSETEDELPAKRQKTEEASPSTPAAPAAADDDTDDEEEERDPDVPPYPLQGKFKSAEDRDYLMGLPELERETILFDRAEEMRNFNERQYLKRRAQQQAELKEVPASRSTREGTSAKLQELKQKRMQRHRSDSEESEDEASDAEASDASVSDSDAASASDAPVEWAEQEKQVLTLSDINQARWGKSEFEKFCHYPGFEQVLRACFVRVSVGSGRYIVGQVVGLQESEPYTFGGQGDRGRRVDQKVLVSYCGDEQPVEMGSCSDGKFEQSEFDKWTAEMAAKGLDLPTKRRVQQKARETTEEQTRVLTSDEIAEMVAKRQQLAGPSGSHVLLQRSALEEQIKAALDHDDEERAEQLRAELRQLEQRRVSRTPATRRANPLDMLSERNRRTNLKSIRKAEVQAQVERRRSGNVIKADPFSRLRTNAKMFYTSSDAPMAKIEEPEQAAAERVQLNAVDSMISKIDIELKIVI